MRIFVLKANILSSKSVNEVDPGAVCPRVHSRLPAVASVPQAAFKRIGWSVALRKSPLKNSNRTAATALRM